MKLLFGITLSLLALANTSQAATYQCTFGNGTTGKLIIENNSAKIENWGASASSTGFNRSNMGVEVSPSGTIQIDLLNAIFGNPNSTVGGYYLTLTPQLNHPDVYDYTSTTNGPANSSCIVATN